MFLLKLTTTSRLVVSNVYQCYLFVLILIKCVNLKFSFSQIYLHYTVLLSYVRTLMHMYVIKTLTTADIVEISDNEFKQCQRKELFEEFGIFPGSLHSRKKQTYSSNCKFCDFDQFRKDLSA